MPACLTPPITLLVLLLAITKCYAGEIGTTNGAGYVWLPARATTHSLVLIF